MRKRKRKGKRMKRTARTRISCKITYPLKRNHLIIWFLKKKNLGNFFAISLMFFFQTILIEENPEIRKPEIRKHLINNFFFSIPLGVFSARKTRTLPTTCFSLATLLKACVRGWTAVDITMPSPLSPFFTMVKAPSGSKCCRQARHQCSREKRPSCSLET